MRNLLWICSQIDATGPYWWSVNLGSGNGLVPLDNKPLPEPMLTQIYVTSTIGMNVIVEETRINGFCHKNVIIIRVIIGWRLWSQAPENTEGWNPPKMSICNEFPYWENVWGLWKYTCIWLLTPDKMHIKMHTEILDCNIFCILLCRLTPAWMSSCHQLTSIRSAQCSSNCGKALP